MSLVAVHGDRFDMVLVKATIRRRGGLSRKNTNNYYYWVIKQNYTL